MNFKMRKNIWLPSFVTVSAVIVLFLSSIVIVFAQSDYGYPEVNAFYATMKSCMEQSNHPGQVGDSSAGGYLTSSSVNDCINNPERQLTDKFVSDRDNCESNAENQNGGECGAVCSQCSDDFTKKNDAMYQAGLDVINYEQNLLIKAKTVTQTQPKTQSVKPKQKTTESSSTSDQLKSTSESTSTPQEVAGNVDSITNTAEILQNKIWSKLKVGDTIRMGDSIRTGKNSALSVKLKDNTYVSLESNGDLVIDKFIYNPHPSFIEQVKNFFSGIFRWVTGKVAPRVDKICDTNSDCHIDTIGIRG